MSLSIWHNGVVWLAPKTRTHAVAAKDGQIMALGDQAT